MNKVIIGVIVAIVVIGGGYFALKKNASMSTASNTPASTTNTTNSTASAPASASTSSSVMNVSTTTNDTSASPETINVSKGQIINLTFKVSSSGTYHGGLDFKSTDPAIDSGSIAEGDSKTIQFTATKSFKFTPYWYQSNVQKDYFVTVNVN
jgi:hypothetical protein